MGDMIGQNFILGAAQGGAHGRKLGHDVDTVALLLDHAREPAHLALDPPEPLKHRSLGIGPHGLYIPLGGSGFKRTNDMPGAVRSNVTVIDPVCGMKVDAAATPHRHAEAGVAYYFCSAGCRSKFIADPRNHRRDAGGEPPDAEGADTA